MPWAPSYVTSAELRAYLRIGDSNDDTQLALAAAAASRAVDNAAGRQFGKVDLAQLRRYPAEWDRHRRVWVVDIDDVMDITGFVVDVAAGPVTVYDLEPANAAAKARPWTALTIASTATYRPVTAGRDVAVTAVWGWTTVPDAIKQATLLQAARFHARRHSPFGVAGSPDLGSELRLLDRVDPDVAVAVGPYARTWAAA